MVGRKYKVLERVLPGRETWGEPGREVHFGEQPGGESGLWRCGSSGYPLALGRTNDRSHDTPINMGEVTSFSLPNTQHTHT